MIKYFGFALILASGILVSREYEKNQRKRLLELSDFIRLFEHIKLKISHFLSPKSDWLSDFSSSSDTVAEFLSSAEKISLSASFEKCENKLSLGAERRLISEVFSSLGRSYKDGEIELLESAVNTLKSENLRLATECEKNVKTFKVLAAAVSLGLIILFI